MIVPAIPALADVGFGPASHTAARQVVRSLYLDFGRLAGAQKKMKRLGRARTLLAVYLHAVPYLVLVLVLGHWFLFGALKLVPERTLTFGVDLAAIALASPLASPLDSPSWPVKRGCYSCRCIGGCFSPLIQPGSGVCIPSSGTSTVRRVFLDWSGCWWRMPKPSRSKAWPKSSG